jgi:diguanylate cyclase (GGDEF)-like protein
MILKLNILTITAVLALFAVFTAVLAHNSYNAELQVLAAKLEAEVQSTHELQLTYYQRDEDSLTQFLANSRANPAILFATSYDNQGQALATSGDNTRAGAAVSFEIIRAPFATAESGLLALNKLQEKVGPTFWSAMTDSSSVIHLSVPVFTALNPTLSNLTAMDFALAFNRPENSITVIGYVQYVLSPAKLLASVQTRITPAIAAMGILALLAVVLSVLVTRKLARPLKRLAKLANNVIAGNQPVDTDIGGGREFEDISRLLELTLGGVDKLKQEATIDTKLAVLTAEERARALSKRNEELDNAETVIRDTKSRLRQMTYYDSLTALPNRRLLTEQLALLLKLTERNKHSLGLLLINLDNFKRFNEALGRSAGDQLLKKVGERLGHCLRDSDLLAQSKKPTKNNIDISRLGGDEFTIVLSQLERPEAAELVAQRIKQALKKPFSIDEHELVITASIGIALAPRNAQDVEELLRAASTAMLHAQNSSSSPIAVYNDKMAAAESNYVSLGADLIKAIAQNQLELLYQPQVSTVDGAVVGAEAILSWEHPEYGQIAVDEIINTAEEIGYVNELGDWVLAEVCQQMKAFIVSGVKLPRVSIKVSSLQLDKSFAQRLKAILTNSGLPAEKLELALSESALMNRLDETDETVASLQDSGVRLSIADFGTSGAALDYLSHFTLDAIRLDSSFVADCDTRPESARLIVAMLAMARSLGLEVLSAGVENEDQCQCLVASGARIQQGTFFSKPVAVNELKPLLVPWHFMEKVQHIAAN